MKLFTSDTSTAFCQTISEEIDIYAKITSNDLVWQCPLWYEENEPIDIDNHVWIGQRGYYDCGVAVLAMLLGKTYEQVQIFFPQSKTEGISPEQCYGFLACRGFRVVTHYPIPATQKYWYPAPFAPLHLCLVDSWGSGHWVVMLANGAVLDPQTPTPQRLTVYPKVYSVSGIWLKETL